MALNRYQLKELFNDVSKLTTSKYHKLIDAIFALRTDQPKCGRVEYTAGNHTISFLKSFATDQYEVFAEGRIENENIEIYIISQSESDFTIYIPDDCTVIWRAIKHNS